MRRPSLVSSLIVLAYLASGCRATGPEIPTSVRVERAPGPEIPTGVTVAMLNEGDSLFNTGSCQRCHGQKGVGGTNGPPLVVGPWLQVDGSYEQIVQLITTGVPREKLKDPTRRPMSPHGGPMQLTDPQVRAVAGYVWSISRAKE